MGVDGIGNVSERLAWAGFDRRVLRCILFPRWHGLGLVNTS